MRIQITGEELTVTAKADRNLTTQEIISCHQLATGNFEALFVEHQGEVIDSKENDEIEIIKMGGEHPTLGEKVQSSLECPVCGCTKRIYVHWGNKFTTCKICNTKLFNASAGEQFGKADHLGNYYQINSVYRDRSGKDEFGSDDLLKEMDREEE